MNRKINDECDSQRECLAKFRDYPADTKIMRPKPVKQNRH